MVGRRLGYLSDEQLARLRQAGVADTLGGRFVVMREAGAGGMGRVFEAKDPLTGRRLAIKVMARRSEADMARFAAEAEILETLAHPAIVAYVAHGTSPEGDPYLAMEWLEGESLATRLRRGPLGLGDALLVAERVAGGLLAAHARRVVHRDLKPSNVMLVGGDPAASVIIDFGVARVRNPAGPQLTRTGQVVGTPGYMAPEQARGERALDGAVDRFALGCLLHEALTGRPAFDSADLARFVEQVQQAGPPAVSALRPDVPPRVDALIAWLLARRAADRPAGSELVEELARIRAGLAAGDRELLAGAPTRPLRESGDAATVPDATRAERPGIGPPRERSFSGRMFGEFVAREQLGKGGFGTVYRAEQPALGREAVIKVLHVGLAASPAAVERFLREARLASRLDHPYASHIYAFGAEADGIRWIAMELVRGTPLDRLLAAQGPISLERFVPLIERICEVVYTAHEQGIVHRDIKPGNVMVLVRAGRLLPKLLDFGIAKLDEPGAAEEAPPLARAAAPPGVGPELTIPGAAMGSPLYMAPEQWSDSAAADARTDIYALGILCFEALTGRPPFVGHDEEEVAAAHALQPLPALGPGLPAALHEVLARATAKDPADRHPSALELSAAVRAASGIEPEPAHVPRLPADVQLAAMAGAPRPIALALDAFDSARNAHQARDGLWQVVRTAVRFLSVTALACHAHVGGGERTALLRLRGRALGDEEWLALARDLVRPLADLRDAHPVPELIDFLIGSPGGPLDQLLALRAEDAGGGSEEKARAVLDRAVPLLARLLEDLAFLHHYLLVVPHEAGAEEWVGVRRGERPRPARAGRDLPPGSPVLLDGDGVPVVELAPFAQVHQPAPGSPPALFFLEGRGRRGARLVALPDAFEHEDEELWRSLGELLAVEPQGGGAAVEEEICPFPGLAAFTAAEAGRFVGRERESEKAVNHLRVSPIVAVVGPSGAGKSSFVQAGVLPILPDGWRAVVVRPGPSPLAALTARLEAAGIDLAGAELRREPERLGAALRAAGRAGTVVLVVDQLEELFTACRDPAERIAYAEALAGALRAADDPVRVVVTLRDDFLVRAESLAPLSGRLTPALHLLTTPAAPELRRILVEPLRRAGYELDDPALPDEMVAEVEGVPGALALLSFTASKMWELRDRRFRQLGRKAYDSLGGVGGALAEHAEATLAAMAPEERRLVREVFHHAVTAEGTRAVLSREELVQLLGGGPHAESVIEKLVVARLLSVGGDDEADRVEISHEALLEAWPRLRTWRQEQTEGARMRDQLRAASRQWQERARPGGLLWRDEALDELRIWRARHPSPLTETEEAFAEASLTEAARERRRRRILFALAFAVLAGAVISLLVLNARVRGEEARSLGRLRSQYEDQGRRLSLDGDPRQALVYLERAGALGVRGPAHDLLVARAVRATGGELYALEHDAVVLRARFSRDGSRLVTASGDGEARVWSASDGRLLARLPHEGAVVRIELSRDGSAVLTASNQDAAGLWDAASGRLRHWLRGHGGGVQEARFSPDGARVVTLGGDMAVRVWDARDGRLTATLREPGRAVGLVPGSPCAFSPDGGLVAAGDADGEVRVWQLEGGRLVRALAGGAGRVTSVRFSPDGRFLIAAGQAGTASIWEVASGQPVATLRHRGPVLAAEPSPDGTAVLTVSADHTAVVWNARTGQPVATFEGHSAAVNAAAFSADGGRVVTASDDGTAVLWDVASGRRLARWFGHRSSIVDVAFDGAGRRVVTASSDGSAIVWSAAPHEPALALRGGGAMESAEFSPAGDRLVTAGQDGSARLWDAASGRELMALGGGAVMYVARFSPDGQRIATTDDAAIDVWDARTGRRERRLVGHAGRVNTVDWHPDGARLVSAANDGAARIWRIADGVAELTLAPDGGARLLAAAFAPSGDTVALASAGGAVTIADARSGAIRTTHRDPDTRYTVAFDRTGERALSCTFLLTAKLWRVSDGAVLTELIGHTGDLTSCRLRPDGALAITGSSDGTARIWDARTGAFLAELTHPAGLVTAADFSPDGSRVVVAGAGGATVWEQPRYTGGPGDLAQLVRCRVPFALDREIIVSRPRDRAACRP